MGLYVEIYNFYLNLLFGGTELLEDGGNARNPGWFLDFNWTVHDWFPSANPNSGSELLSFVQYLPTILSIITIAFIVFLFILTIWTLFKLIYNVIK